MGIEVLSQPLLTGAFSGPLADAGLLFVFLIAAGVTAMTFVGFAIWIFYMVARIMLVVLARALATAGCRSRPRPVAGVSGPAKPQWLACPDPVCRTVNPEQARFCRQCGRMIRRTVNLAA